MGRDRERDRRDLGLLYAGTEINFGRTTNGNNMAYMYIKIILV